MTSTSTAHVSSAAEQLLSTDIAAGRFSTAVEPEFGSGDFKNPTFLEMLGQVPSPY